MNVFSSVSHAAGVAIVPSRLPGNECVSGDLPAFVSGRACCARPTEYFTRRECGSAVPAE